MRVIVKKPDQPPTVEDIATGLESSQAVVGGLIDVVSLAEGLDLVVNDEGAIRAMPLNLLIAGEVEPIPICGAVFFVGVDEEGTFHGLTDEQVETISRLWVAVPGVPVPVLRLPSHVDADARVNVPTTGNA